MNSRKICVPVSERVAGRLKEAIDRAASVADIIEIRLDYLEGRDFNEALQLLPTLLSGINKKFILTYRPEDQGGQHPLAYRDRYAFWSKYGTEPISTLIDIELDLALDLMAGSVPIKWKHVVCSYHDFNGVPSELNEIYERLSRTPSKVLKLAVKANTITDCIPVLNLIERARNEGREIIVIAMGEAGLLTRILAPSLGAFLTFASSDPIHATAPGQISARDMHELYRVSQIDEETEIMGLIGLPISHSVSPHMHNAAFAYSDLNSLYIPFEVSNIKDFIVRMVHPKTRELKWRLKGLSVTAPHKSSIMEHLDYIDPLAKNVGAVNTVVVKDDLLYGYNTDVEAAIAPLRDRVGTLKGSKVAVIGAGGAARAVLWGLKNEDASMELFARNLDKAKDLAEIFNIKASLIDQASFKNFDVVINTTPVGTKGKSEDQSPVLKEQLAGARLAYDLIYNPSKTRFMREAEEMGCESLGGLPMLVGQAIEQFRLWTNRDAPTDVMYEAARKVLGI
jgi:3-dehydroquinate dehydratase / shikimate dehydrogenase